LVIGSLANRLDFNFVIEPDDSKIDVLLHGTSFWVSTQPDILFSQRCWSR
jgi:hypothetical protein